ncbi:hypothetical protein LTR37_020829 [Vermiconidia calcicola]|uniref:Uncharacterized protein n=1 Tax=Vermiconidia calcicola TaxID=1690605 RepID=A0ACC3MAC5_9PEZI|nr:hypothetical protein LTR37_020829 [Vermiconidia calcicola]
MTKFNITIISDTVCPWCYVGYRNLQSAITQHLGKHPGDTFEISWHPFQLNPNAPRGVSVDKARSYESKLGAQQAQIVFERLKSAGEKAGIKFSFRGRTGNTLDSHRLIEFARAWQASSKGAGACVPSIRSPQTRVVEELFAAYFEHEQDITSHDVIAAAAGQAGLYEKQVRTFLAGDELAGHVSKEAESNRRGVSGVPHFTINDVFAVEGAQEPAAFTALFDRYKKKFEGGRAASL